MSADLEPAEVTSLLRRLGYRPADGEEDSPGGIRRRWTALGTYLFHGAFFLVALGFLLTLAMRQEATVWVAVGEEYTGDPGQLLSQSPPKPLAAGVPLTGFRVDDIRPSSGATSCCSPPWRPISSLPPAVVPPPASTDRCGSAGRPFCDSRALATRRATSSADAYGRVLDSSFVKLNLFPPGQRDYFSPPDYPHRIYLEVFPITARRRAGR